MIVRVVDKGRIVDNHCLNFLFLKKIQICVFRQKNGNRSFPFYVFLVLFSDKTITDFTMSNTTDVLLETRAAHRSGSHGFTSVVLFLKSPYCSYELYFLA